LIDKGYVTELVPYPVKSGLQFRFVAQAAGVGEIGTNAFLFHSTWGPWVHLRVMATTADLDIHPQFSGNELCDQCDLCITECPAEAILKEDFDGLRCRSYRKAKGEYEPYGPNRQYQYCKICALVCPKGPKPLLYENNSD
jgi:epoxyqueuosine reductase QueG